jgi:hypothetical protein
MKKTMSLRRLSSSLADARSAGGRLVFVVSDSSVYCPDVMTSWRTMTELAAFLMAMRLTVELGAFRAAWLLVAARLHSRGPPLSRPRRTAKSRVNVTKPRLPFGRRWLVAASRSSVRTLGACIAAHAISPVAVSSVGLLCGPQGRRVNLRHRLHPA